MLRSVRNYFHRWEQELAAVSQHERKVRPFDWGADWLDEFGGTPAADPGPLVKAWVDGVMKDTDAFFTPEPARYHFTKSPETLRAQGEEGLLTFTSGLATPHPENNTVICRYFPARPIRKARPGSPRRAVVVLAQWNSDPDGHIGLCKLLAKLGIASLRISLPYHDARMPPELTRADYIVSSNIVRTLQVCRQAVRDVRLALWWLRDQGYDRLGLLGTSLGSCLSYLTTCHEPLVKAQALNHVSPYFGDVVWRGLSTEHVRAGLDGHVDIEQLRELWRPISPWSYVDRLRDKQTLMVYAKYDLTFPVDLSLQLINEIRRRGYPLQVRVLPCGHYSTGVAPFKYLDGWYLGKFLATRL
ncbi:MAG TPA: alpha/beta hydrolase family protein [Vicinamibacterales bacterium]|nr:alpha/beta hydrolase family protein [Vicinamibacterales bacterium]